MSNSVKITIAAFVAAGAFFYFMLPGTKDLVRVSSLSSSGAIGNNISGKLTTKGQSGEVYFWIEQDGKVMCPRKTYIEANVERPFSITCAAMTKRGHFNVMTDRNPSDWVKKHAASL